MPGNCAKCNELDTEQMVACDSCNAWLHFECALVSPGVADREFQCENCTAKREKRRKGKRNETLPPKSVTKNTDAQKLPLPTISGAVLAEEEPAANKSDTASLSDVNQNNTAASAGGVNESRVQIEFRRMGEQLSQVEKELEEEKIIREKQLEVERIIAEKRSQVERELRQKRLAQEEAILERQLKEEAEFCKRQHSLREKYKSKSVGEQFANKNNNNADDLRCNDEDKNKLSGANQVEGVNSRVSQWLAATPKRNPDVAKPVPGRKAGESVTKVVNNQSSEESESDRGSIDTPSRDKSIVCCSNNMSPGPTRAQRSARQVLSKKLPIFTGRCDEWPLFYSSFLNSTEACGFTEVENLVRLQESLKGPALEAVRSRLLLPRGVPQVINTLRMLYGRPEQLVHTLLNKVRKTDAPKADRLDTFIPFGMAVQELCDHLEAAELCDHLVNPILLQELIDKLPASTKREWLQYKRMATNVTLRTFADFIYRIVTDASEVTIDVKVPYTSRAEKSRAKEKGIIYAHRAEVSATLGPKQPCIICNQHGHRVRSCDEFRCLSAVDRVRLMQQHKLCERCLNVHEGWCRFKINCNVGSCRMRHHPLVHSVGNLVESRQLRQNVSKQNVTTEVHNAHISKKLSVIFRIIPIIVYNGSSSVKTLAYLDEGSSITLIEDSLAAELNARGAPQPLTLQWTGNIVRQEQSSECLNLKVSGLQSERSFDMNNVRTVRKLYLPRQAVSFRELASRYVHLNGLDGVDQTNEEPRILIGLNNVYLLAPLESRVGKPNEPIAVRSHLGWTIYGPQQIVNSNDFLGHHVEVTNEELYDKMREYFAIEEASVTVRALPESESERRAKELLRTTTVRVNGGYETGLLWKEDDFQFPSSKQMAIKRLEHLERRLKKNPIIEQHVRKQVQEYQTKGYAHVASRAELDEAEPSRIWYLPLNYVVHPKKPDKVRLVWDAAAQVNGVSLNSMLLVGPDLLTSLPAVIQLFRERTVAFSADIREMYHQIRIKKSDKHAQRFLFRVDPLAKEPEVFLMDVATFGSACSPASAQYIKNLNAAQFAEQFPKAVQAISRRHYVDDYLDATDTIDEAIMRAKQVRHIHSHAGFDLRRWASNSDKFLHALGEAEYAESITLNDNKDSNTTRVLGIIWCCKQDVFMFSTAVRDDLAPYLTTTKRPTKRIALSCIMVLFDPLGLLAPFTIQGKVLIQDLWRAGCNWDQMIDDCSFEKWTRWRSLLPQIEKLRIPRCYLRGTSADAYDAMQLHIFVDAGEKAYGGVAYFRIMTPAGPRCSLVMAKTKVAPLKPLSIPRLELQAAILGVRLLSAVETNQEVKPVKRFIWTDSKTVLSWIRADHRKYKPFVAVRIGEILQETSVDEWNWVPSRANVADILTKWSNEFVLDNNGRWFNGPDFLQFSEQSWPSRKLPTADTAEELRVCHMIHNYKDQIPLINVARISKWQVLMRTVCTVLRFLSNCKRCLRGLPTEAIEVPAKLQNRDKNTCTPSIIPFKQEEYQEAEFVLWRMAQNECFPNEIAVLRKNKSLPKEEWSTVEKTSLLYRLGPFFDEHDVLRIDGRTKLAEMIPYDARFPIILPRTHAVTFHVINQYHLRFAHAFKETVVNELRQRFYIPKLRACVSKIVKSCQYCKVRKCKPLAPKMAPLPVERLTPFIKPFSHVGIDYFGPINVTIGRRSEKRWIVIFTCLSVRAIHLEVAYKLDRDSCIMAIRRFVLRRGPPIAIFSDNGTNLKAANKELQQQIRQIDNACANVFTNAKTRWTFNPPSAPHMGGVWERMVRTVKETMATLVQTDRLNDELLLTIIVEVEEIVNARPLVYMPDEPTNSAALTPNHFVKGSSSGLQDPSIAPTDIATALRSSYKRTQYVADSLWQRWLKEYLPSLNVRSKWLESREPLKPGDLVFIVDDHGRNGWVRGQVEQVITGKDGYIRQAVVRTNTGSFRRPVVKLAPIEIATVSKSDQDEDPGQGLRAREVLDPPCDKRSLNLVNKRPC